MGKGGGSAGRWMVAALGVAGGGLVGIAALAIAHVPAGWPQQLLGVLCLVVVVGLAVGVRAMTREILRPLRESAAAARRIVEGDLSKHDTVDCANGELLGAMDELREQTFKIVSDVRTRALAVATSSGHIRADQSAFSSALRSQADALERTASTLEQLTAAVQHNADNASRGHELATSALSLASQGGQVVRQVVETMGTIRGSSHKIVDIISVIDGIAFQTNILALNAAVEAARAGEQGRGFAVVASEVRNLATRSAEAAKAVKGLIEDSVNAVNSGATLVDRAGDTMQQIVTSVQRVTEIMTEMSAAAREQSDGIAEINDAVVKIDAATQQNANIIDTAAEPVQALHEQTVGLTDAVANFKLGEGEFASEEDAKGLVQKAAQFIRTQGSQAFVDEVNKLDASQLVDRDLYLSVYHAVTGRCVAHGSNKRLIGADTLNFKDLDGKRFVADILNIAKAQNKGHVTYRWLHPLTQKAMTKSTFFEKHGDLIYACGAYSMSS